MLLLTVTTVSAFSEIDIPAGDTQALLDAIHVANESGEPTLIRLASNAAYPINLTQPALEPIQGHLIVEGQNAQLTSDGSLGFGQVIRVRKSGFLELRNLIFSGFDSGADFEAKSTDGLVAIEAGGTLEGSNLRFENMHIALLEGTRGAIFSNFGNLFLDRVRITNITQGNGLGIALGNSGTARLQNLLIADSVQKTPENPDSGGFLLFNNAPGHIEILYSTLLANSDLSASEVPTYFLSKSDGLGIVATETLRATMIVGLACTFYTASKGFNLATDDSCQFDGPGDLLGVSPAPLSVSYDNGLKVIPLPGSPALDGVSRRKFECVPTDVLGTPRPQDGDGNGKARCDIGAFEAPAPAALFEGGANGLYFDASHDGHYVLVQEVRPNQYFVHWTAFDLDGNQSWIFAVGSREGDTIAAQAWLQTEGVLIPGGSVDVNTDALEDWGTVSVRLDDCLKGEFSYQSVLPRFGSGSFPLDRLAFIDKLGCRDSAP